jgi:CRISPR system Cascade subunit CasA
VLRCARLKKQEGDFVNIENKFNLVDSPWIPIADKGRVSLKQIFTQPDYRALGGNPVQKIAVMKLLLAIAQAACTPEDNDEWKKLGAEGLAQKCLAYLEKWHDRFYLYGEKPFLQMPAVVSLIDARTVQKKSKAKNNPDRLKAEEKAKPKSFGAGFYPDLPSENNTMLSNTLFEQVLSDAEKAVFIISIMNLALGGKRVEADLMNFSGQTYGDKYSAKSAPSLGNYVGYLHNYLIGKNLLSSLWLNLLTHEQVKENRYWENGLGIPPWEIMPTTETCDVANQLKTSYMGCLVAMSRFAFLKDDGVYYLDGIQYPSHKDGWCEPSIAINRQKEIKVVWLNPNKRPWRELTSLLSFISATTSSQNNFDCQQISFGYKRAIRQNQKIGIWSGGLKIRGSSGDQSVKQDDDFVESSVFLPSKAEREESEWFDKLEQEMTELEHLSKIVYGSTFKYFDNLKADAKNQAAQATHLFWQLCERRFQDLVDACGEGDTKALRKTFAHFASTAYNSYCSHDTARQLDAWAKNLPNFGKYLKDTKQQEVEA